MILRQYYLSCLSHASYLIGDESFGNPVFIIVSLATAAAAVLATRHVRRREHRSWTEAGLGLARAAPDLGRGFWIGVVSFSAVPVAAVLLGWATIEPADG